MRVEPVRKPGVVAFVVGDRDDTRARFQREGDNDARRC